MEEASPDFDAQAVERGFEMVFAANTMANIARDWRGDARPLGHFDIRSGDVRDWMAKLAAYLPFTYPFNVTGQPAASVPLYWTADGLPIGCQFASRYGEEGLLLRLCAQLETARPWFHRRPSVSGLVLGD